MVWLVVKQHREVNPNFPAGAIYTVHPTEALALAHMRECMLPQIEGKDSWYHWEKMEHIDMEHDHSMWIVQTDWYKDDEDLGYEDQFFQTPPCGVQGENLAAFLDAAHAWAHNECDKDKDDKCTEDCVVDRRHLYIKPANTSVWTPGTKFRW